MKIKIHADPLQNGKDPNGWGFGQDTQNLLKSYGVNSAEQQLDLPDFEAFALAECQKGFNPIFSVPSHLVIDYANKTARIVYHTWISNLRSGSLEYLSRAYNQSQILPPLPLATVYQRCVRN